MTYRHPISRCQSLMSVSDHRYGSKTSTGNLSGHLQKKHGVHPVSKNGETESTTKKQPQHSAANSGVKARRAAKTSTKKTEGVTRLSKELATWLARDLNPLSIVEGQGFKDFCRHFKIISGEGSIPGRHIISRVGLNDVYFSTVNIAKKLLQTAPKTIVVTFDSWTDRRKRQSHITYTIHWIDTQWKSQRVPLTTSCFPYPPLPSTIAENVNEVISEFGLADRKCIFVTGGGCNVKNACELHNVQQIDCVAYGVDLLLNKDFITDHLQLQGLTDTIEKLKTIYKQLIYRQSDLQRIFEEKHDTKLDEILDFLIDLGKTLTT